MKDKLIFIASLALVIFGLAYLGYTSYKFFNRGNQNNQNTQTQQSSAQLSLVGSSNKDILGEGLNIGQEVMLQLEAKNDSQTRESINLEGRVYKTNELSSFPNLDAELPKNTQQVPLLVNANSTATASYSYTTTECGNFYIALGNNDFWQNGRGLVTFGFFSVNCEGSTPTNEQTTPVSQTNEPTNTQPTLNAMQAEIEKRRQQQVQGTTTKGGVQQEVTELPKAGPTENLMLLGAVLLLGGFAYKLSIKTN